MAEPLTERDRQILFEQVVPKWMIERLDTRLGTAKAVTVLKNGGNGVWGGAGGYPGDPSLSFWSDRRPQGFDVSVRDDRKVVRQGRVTWNELANRATGAALDRKYAAKPQLELF